MPRRVDSDEEDFKPQKKKAKSTTKSKTYSSKPKAKSSKTKSTSNEPESVISAWAKRRTVESLDGIEDVEIVSPQKEILKPRFEIVDDFERIPAVAQIAVHKRKVTDVSKWLKEFPHHRKKMLVLSGPAGSGKSTTVQSLAKDFGMQIVEWINPIDENKLSTQNDEIDSLSRKFSVFLQNSQRYASLDSANPNSNQLILIQDLPNTIGSSHLISQVRTIFQTSLKEFLASSRVRYPIILIVTESEVGSGEDFGYANTYREGLTVKGLLGDEILNNPATTHILFRPIAPTIMVKALMGMPQLKGLPKPLMQSIVDIAAGDIRSAINCATLVALQLRQTPRRKADVSILAGLECREGGLDLFHAAGRVVYNKRYGDEPEDPQIDVPSLPPHLSSYTRRASRVDIDDTLTSVQTDISTLRSLIHHNFPLSCNSSDEIDDISAHLSDTDFLFPLFPGTSPLQDRLAAYYTVGGVLLGLPSPVAKRADFTMKWPESSRLPTKIRESRERLERCVKRWEGPSGRREDMLLDILPYARIIGKAGDAGMKREISLLCGFPLRGRVVMEEVVEEEEVAVGKSGTGGWLEDDDIED